MRNTIRMTVRGSAAARIEREHTDGIARLCRALLELGMAHESDVPEFPYGDHLGRADYDSLGRPLTPRARRYEEARAAVLADHGSRGPHWNIPVHKLASGDGWLVTASECKWAIAAWETAADIRALGLYRDAPDPDSLDADVLPFLHAAAAHDGFRVH